MNVNVLRKVWCKAVGNDNREAEINADTRKRKKYKTDQKKWSTELLKIKVSMTYLEREIN